MHKARLPGAASTDRHALSVSKFADLGHMGRAHALLQVSMIRDGCKLQTLWCLAAGFVFKNHTKFSKQETSVHQNNT
jgi:hypothetical protein